MIRYEMRSLLFWVNLSVLLAIHVAPSYGVKENDLPLYSQNVCMVGNYNTVAVHLQRRIEDHLHRSSER